MTHVSSFWENAKIPLFIGGSVVAGVIGIGGFAMLIAGTQRGLMMLANFVTG